MEIEWRDFYRDPPPANLTQILVLLKGEEMVLSSEMGNLAPMPQSVGITHWREYEPDPSL